MWLDTWAFEAALDADDVNAALALYRGHFLGARGAGAVDAAAARPAAGAARARRPRRRRGAARRARNWTAARALYQRALEVDNLAEAVYRRLMVCQRESGDPAGALTAYRRCRELLSIVLNRAPAPETEAVRQTLQ